MGFSKQEYWNGLPFPSPGDLPDRGMEPRSFVSPTLAGEFFITSTTWEALVSLDCYKKIPQDSIPDRTGGRKAKTRMPADLIPSERPLPDGRLSQVLTCLFLVHEQGIGGRRERERERKQTL